MNIGDTSGLKDEKKMDSNKVWQWRIMHAKKYSISPEPFHYSNKIGLNFNVASNTQKKLDLDLVTNGVILEVCDFAKTVIKGKGHFITQILENNFELGLENEQHRADFTAQILHKVKDLIRKPPEDKHKVFMLFDEPSNLECTNNNNNGLHMACREGKTESFPVEMDDTDDSEEEDRFNYSQATSKEYMTENLSDFESDESKQKCSGPTTELKEVLPFSFPCCEEIGLSLDIGSKQSLDIGLFTKGVMLELVHFTRVLTASYNRMILDVLEHNFELDLKNEHVKNQVLFKVSHLLKRRKQLNIIGNKTEFKNEPFPFHTNPLKEPRGSSLSNEQEKSGAVLTTSEQGPEEHRQGQSKHMETNTLSHETTLCTSRKTEGDHSDTYAQEESALDSDKQGHLKHPKYTDVPRDSESSCLTTTDISSTLPVVNTIVNPPFESQPDKKGFCGAEEETQTPRKSPNKSDMEQKEMGTEHKKKVLARIPAIMEQSELSAVTRMCNNKKQTRNNMSTMEKTDCLNNLNLDSCSAGSSQAAVIDQNVGSSADTEHQNDLDLKMWKLRANHIQRILSMPHEEHCPLYSYSRCKKLGIDFNVGSGMKQNLDPKLLTNGIMLEVITFAKALSSAQKHFITEILEHNFDLNFENELSRSAFADKVMRKIQIERLHKNLISRQYLMKKPFELPDVRCIEEPSYAKTLHCPKCYQDQKFYEDEPDPAHMHHPRPHTMSDTVSADVKCTTQRHAKDASSTFSTTEETIMNSNRRCKQIGLNLCVDKDPPKDKLDMHVLTNSVMKEVVQFAKKLCGTNNVVINDVLKHNFNTGMLHRSLSPAELYQNCTSAMHKNPDRDWLNEVFVLNRPRQLKRAPAIQKSNCLESIKKRKLTLQTKQETANMPSGSGEIPYPVCTAIGLDLDVTSNSREKVILDLKLLTRAVVFEIHKFATLEVVNYYPRTVFDILDYNFDLSSQHYRRWEFSIATASKIQTMVKEYCKKDDNTEDADEVFKLPFMFDPVTSQQRVEKRQNIKGTNSSMDTANESNSSCVDIHTHFLTSANMLSSLPTVNSNMTSKIGNQPDDRGFYGDEEQTQTPRNAPNEWNMEQEEIRTENYYTCPLEESDLESDEVSDSENTGKQDHLRNPESFFPSSDIVSELESSCMDIHAPFFTSINHQSDIEQEEMRTEHNMWKLRSNRVEQILIALTKEFGPLNRSKRAGLEYNVGFGPKKNISVDSLKDPLLLEIGKFALAMNSSQKDFIMEILEYNFDLNLPSQHHRNIFASDIMTRVRQLRSCGDEVKFSNEVFKLPGLVASINVTAQSEGGVNPELGISKMGKCDVPPVCPPDSHAETKEHISCRSEDLYTLCKEIGLNLHVNNSQPNKKLDINKLTNGAMTEVTNFAEKLCGTFEQICLDILGHNLDFDLQRDSELAENILARISALIERTMEKQDCPDNPNLDTCSAGSSKAAVIDQNVGTSADTKHQNNLDLKMWKLRANHIQRILSMPHEEHCPLDYYSRCKKLGIDFNVGSGMRQNLDPKLLTNGIMVELNTFATALSSAQKHFITEILEHNFDLNFENELSRSAFADKVMRKIHGQKLHKINLSSQPHRLKKPFELPDVRWIEELSRAKTLHFPKCYQDQKLHEDESDPGHMHHPRPHTISDTFSAEVKCTTQKHAKDASSTFSMTEETIMDSNRRCKQIGLNLCVDKDLPKHKLGMHVLTAGAMIEVLRFAKKLCGTNFGVINDVLKHNFNIGKQSRDLNPARLFYRQRNQNDGGPAWFNKVFVIQSYSNKPPGYMSKVKWESVLHTGEKMENIKKRQLELQTKQERASNHRSGDEEETQTLRNPPNKSGIEQEEMGTEHNMWKLRSNRVEQILSALTKDFGRLSKSKRVGLEYNVGFGPKQNISVESLKDPLLLEIGKFALAMNLSQKDFIMEILEYNFDLNLPSQHHRNIFASDIMTRVRQLRSCGDEVKFSNEVFKLPGLVASINMTAQSEDGVNPELGISKMGKCDVAPVCPPDSHAETKEDISCRSEDLYPLCKEIGLNLHVSNSQPNKKLEINKLTNGAMTEVANFAGKLCGTFEQICLDILRHNLDFDLQRDSELAKNILARIPALIERRNLSVFSKSHKNMTCTMNDMSTMEKPDCPDNPNLNTCSASSSQAAVIDQNVGSSADTEHQNDLDLKLWKLRASHVQRILSMPHREYCPFYSYSRCRKLGIDFNVGSGVKQNLDPKFLTNGVMVELNTFATELFSAQKHFIIEVLEYNFDLNFENDLCRSAFAKQIMTKIGAKKGQWKIDRLPFELPDTRCIQEPIRGNILPCPKCYQDRNHEVLKDKSDPVHVHHPHPSTMTGTDSTDVNCTAQQPTEDPFSTFFTAEETIMEGYPLCKETGLNLCVDKDKPKNKLDTRILTYGILTELANFARKLCGIKSKVIIDVFKHNFNISMLHRCPSPAELLTSAMQKKGTDPDWFNEVFVLPTTSNRQLKRAPAIQKSNCLESIKKRKLALHSNQSQSQSQSQGQGQDHVQRVIKSKPNYSICYPLCSEIGLDLDVTSESEEKEKLDLKLLTRAVVAEIHKYASNKLRHYYPRTVFDILDYNFDLSSQHYRRWEFSIATAFEVQSVVKKYRKNKVGADEIFKLPFVFAPQKKKRTKSSQGEPEKKRTEGSCVHQVGHHSDVNHFNLLSGVQTEEEPCSHDEDTKSSIDHWTMNVQKPGLVSVGCGSPLQENIQIKKEEYDPHYDKPEPDTEENYHPQHVDVKAESNICDVEQLILCEPAGSHGYAVITQHPNSESNIKSESESEN